MKKNFLIYGTGSNIEKIKNSSAIRYIVFKKCIFLCSNKNLSLFDLKIEKSQFFKMNFTSSNLV